MTALIAFASVRVAVAFILELLIALVGMAELTKPATHAEIVWRHIWPSVVALGAIVILWPLLRRGDFLFRSIAALLMILPCLVLFYVVANQFDFSTPLDRWFYGLG